jgi:hypothetical protein
MRLLAVALAAVAVLPAQRMTVPVPAFPSAIAVGGGSVWALAGGRLVRISPRKNSAIAWIDLGVRVGSELTCDLAVADGVVWVIGAVNATRSRVNVERRVNVSCPGGAQIRSAEGQEVGRSGISRSVKQVLSFGCGLLRLRCSTCVVAPHLAWP